MKSKRTLFLDRDGVINKQILGGYVTSVSEFEFLPNVLNALRLLSAQFDYMIVVTNQQCVGKNLLSKETLTNIHAHMVNVISLNGGRIDAVYFAPNLASEQNILRKPLPGMAQLAQKDFPNLSFEHSLMVGDSWSDMKFGKNVGMKTVFLHNNGTAAEEITHLSDYVFENLWDFCINQRFLS